MKISYINIKDYTDVISNDDVLLFHGTGFISETIENVEEIFEGSNTFSHIGTYTSANLYPLYQNQLKGIPNLILESTAQLDLLNLNDDIPDLLTNSNKYGVQIRDLDLVLNSYLENKGTFIAIGKVKKPTIFKETELKLNQAFITKFGSKSYETNLINLAANAIPFMRPVRDFFNGLWYGFNAVHMPPLPFYDLSQTIYDTQINDILNSLEATANMEALCCVELVGLKHKMLKIIPATVNPANLAPVDYVKNGYIESLIYIQK